MQVKISVIQKSDVIELQGHFNAKMCNEQHFGLDQANDRGQQLLKFIAIP